jgi:hypothetical protein
MPNSGDNTMPNPLPLSDFRELTDTNKYLVIWQGLSDIWNKLDETLEKEKSLEADVHVHEKLLITGNGDPAVMERIRNLENFVKSFKYWTGFVFGALIIQTLAFAWAVFVALVKVLPVLERMSTLK